MSYVKVNRMDKLTHRVFQKVLSDLRTKSTLFAFIPLSLFAHSPQHPWPGALTIRLGNANCLSGPIFQAKTAQTIEEREKGLSGRKEPLGITEAMVFVWDKKAESGFFWMKDTLIPLTLLYFDAKGKLLSVYEMPVESNPSDPQFYYLKPDGAQVAIELAGGSSKQFIPWSSFTLCIQK